MERLKYKEEGHWTNTTYICRERLTYEEGGHQINITYIHTYMSNERLTEGGTPYTGQNLTYIHAYGKTNGNAALYS